MGGDLQRRVLGLVYKWGGGAARPGPSPDPPLYFATSNRQQTHAWNETSTPERSKNCEFECMTMCDYELCQETVSACRPNYSKETMRIPYKI